MAGEVDQKRNLTFGVMLLLLWIGWMTYGPVLFPGLFPVVPNPQQVAEKEDEKDAAGEQAAANAEATDPDGKKPDEAKPFKLPDHPVKTVSLGAMDQDNGYGLQVELTSVGASIAAATLNDPRYVVSDNVIPRPQLKVVGNNLEAGKPIAALDPKRKPLTFDLELAKIDAEFAKLDRDASSKNLSWEVVGTTPDADNKEITSSAKFRLTSPDGKLSITKTYTLNRMPKDKIKLRPDWDLVSAPYDLDVSILIENQSNAVRSVSYVLQGPVGLPLENKEIATKYRDVKAGFLDAGGDLVPQSLTATELVKSVDKNAPQEWPRPFRYAGIDVQYFAALLLPTAPQLQDQYFESTKPILVERAETKEYSDISLLFTSKTLDIPAEGNVEHKFKLFLGPKRQELLESHEADAVFDYGWFGSISHLLVNILRGIHSWGIPYGIAIMILTGMVRTLMFPISKKQAASSNKMKELQPLLNEMREKYKDDKQKQAQAQMELYKKAGFNPFGGCLLAFLQLPVFIALYQALNNSVDLRMAPFLYIDNLAAPDALFPMPFALPFLGQDFNLLPIITLVLYFVQQKAMMPPPTNEEMAMQQKMMNYMLIFMGFMFYKVPAGLCVYFICSTLWGMGERKLIGLLPHKPIDLSEKKMAEPAKEGFLQRLMRQAQEAADMQQQLQREQEKRKGDSNRNGDDRKGGKGNR